MIGGIGEFTPLREIISLGDVKDARDYRIDDYFRRLYAAGR